MKYVDAKTKVATTDFVRLVGVASTSSTKAGGVHVSAEQLMEVSKQTCGAARHSD